MTMRLRDSVRIRATTLAFALTLGLPILGQESTRQGSLSSLHLLESLREGKHSGKPVDLILHGASLHAVFLELEKASGFDFDVDPAIGDRVTYELRQIPWDAALAIVLADNKLRMDVDLAGTGFKVYRGEKLVVASTRPARLKVLLFLYRYLWEIGVTVFLLSGVMIGVWMARRPKSGRQPPRKKALLPAEEADRIKRKLISRLEDGKIYRLEDLSLPSLAEQLSVTPHQLSWILNVVLRRSFSSLVNGYRVEEVKGRLSDPSFDHESILQVAFDAGFNTKASFNRAFKKHAGMTPSEFKRKSIANPRGSKDPDPRARIKL